MRVPKVEHYKGKSSQIKTVKIDKPIIIPRLPVVTTEKQKDKLIKTIERLIRSSMEYKDLIKYLRDYINMDECEFFPNFKAGKKRGMIEIHHAPYDLYTLTWIVMEKQEQEFGVIDELDVAEELMYLHYEGFVGLIPLSITAHELVHDGKLIVPLNCVRGRFVQFTKDYFPYIQKISENKDTDLIAMLKENIALTNKLTRKDFSILDTQYVYTEVDGCVLPKIMAA